MQNYSTNPICIIESVWTNRNLISTSVKREVLGRYRGSFLGLMWSFLNPLFMLVVYTFVFSEVFKARWIGGSETKIEFAMVLFAGLIIFNMFAECINRAPSLIINNQNYVKKVVFPIEILPIVDLICAIYHTTASLLVWVLAYWALVGTPHLTVVLIPIIIVPFSFFVVGVGWFLASLGVYLRDVIQIIGFIVTALMFLSPIFYPVNAVPENYRYLLYLNPLTYPIEMSRYILWWGRVPEFYSLGIYWATSVAFASLGFAWFQKTRKGFADVL